MAKKRPKRVPEFLKDTRNNRIYRYTPILAARECMVYCEEDGTVWPGQLDVPFNPKQQKPGPDGKFKYVGIIANERLLPWTKTLSEKTGTVEVNSEEEWRTVLARIKAEAYAKKYLR